MNQRAPIRLSTMEIALIGSLIAMLVLSLLQARHDEHRHDHHNDHDGSGVATRMGVLKEHH